MPGRVSTSTGMFAHIKTYCLWFAIPVALSGGFPPLHKIVNDALAPFDVVKHPNFDIKISPSSTLVVEPSMLYVRIVSGNWVTRG